MKTKRRELFEQIQTLLAGHTVADGWGALGDSFAAMIAFAADDRQHAETLLDVTRSDLARSIDQNWDYVREVRAQSRGAGRT